jgi:hypothetical protein
MTKIIQIIINNHGVIYGLGSDSVVYKWESDGSWRADVKHENGPDWPKEIGVEAYIQYIKGGKGK